MTSLRQQVPAIVKTSSMPVVQGPLSDTAGDTPPLTIGLIVTGAFGFTGQYITRRLLHMGEAVVNLTGHPARRHAFGGRVPSRPFNFDTPIELAKTLEAASALYNTYWARFP
jgi:hypothetical protein